MTEQWGRMTAEQSMVEGTDLERLVCLLMAKELWGCMMAELSKTARQAVQAAEGVRKQTAKGWIFERIAGKLQTKPYMTFFVPGAARGFAEKMPERDFIVVEWAEVIRRK